ncbi:cytochrome P450 [Pseudonocardia alni]|uniref:Cytochrome P450 n=1 Tax=Pseudonocardia alni TaxID=33907 RepID=A0A852W7F3_PSEA5|nr:cytochrome P450 [Pseudonocardia antarctica]NYG05008.1 cytochrome P450 [Pseudonocardia antarctica]
MTTTEAPQLPFDRPNIIDVAPLYAVLRREGPVVPVRTPVGDPAWLVTRHAEARALFADPRLGRSHPEPESAARVSEAAILGGPSGTFEREKAEHDRMRRLLVPAFSAKRMRLLGDHVGDLVDGCLDDLVAAKESAADGVADLHAHLAFPLPVLVICELLGVPFADRGYFHGLSERVATIRSGGDAEVAMGEFRAYLGRLAEAKRAQPGEDVVTDLVRAREQDPDFGEEEMTRLAAALLFAGHETTVGRIDLGVLLLLTDPARRDAFVADVDGRLHGTVEEVLRLSSPGGLALLRYAHSDIGVGDVTIRRGDAVMIATASANRDAEVFDDAEAFDPTRRPNPHVSFGYGGHFCIGASLARTELATVFARLFRRLPGLRLPIAPEELQVRSEQVTGGVRSLPVTW